MKHFLLWIYGFSILITSCSLKASEPLESWEVEPVFLATFDEGKIRADRLPVDPRMSRFYAGRDGRRSPYSDKGDRIPLTEGIIEDGQSGYGFRALTDAGFRAVGGFNVESGTFGFWLNMDTLRGGESILFSTHTMQAGGPHPVYGGVTQWALGIGTADNVGVPEGHLYLATSQQQLITPEPVKGAGWVHIAAVWSMDRGIQLYLNGERIASSWRSVLDAKMSENDKEIDMGVGHVWFPAEGFRDACEKARVRVGTASGQSWTSLLDYEGSDDVTIGWDLDSLGGALYVQSETDERVQLRFRSIRDVPSGQYRLRIRYLALGTSDAAATPLRVRMTTREQDEDGRPAGEAKYEHMEVPAIGSRAWREEVRMLTLGESADGLHTLNMDVNIHVPGEYRIRTVALESGDFSAESPLELINSSAGVRWTWSFLHREAYPIAVDRLWIRGYDWGPAYDSLVAYDVPLSEDGIKKMMTGEYVFTEKGNIEDDWIDPELAMARLDWGGANQGDLIPIRSGEPVIVREAVVDRAFEDRRLAGWLAVDGRQGTIAPWWYHGYRNTHPRYLHIHFLGEEILNYAIVRSDLIADVRAGGSREDPQGGQHWFNLEGRPGVTRMYFDESVETSSISVAIEEGGVSGMHFYAVKKGDPFESIFQPLEFYLHPAAAGTPPLNELQLAEWITSYAPAQRTRSEFKSQPADRPFSKQVDALHAVHFFTEPMSDDFAFDALRLELAVAGLKENSRVQIRVADSLALWRELGRFDFQFQESESQPSEVSVLDLTLDLRDTLILAGDTLQLTLIFENAVVIESNLEGRISRLQLYPADREEAASLWLEWHLSDWRNSFESMSEPRPWGSLSSDDDSNWWMRINHPHYDHMHHIGSILLEQFPDNPRVAAWYHFIHPMDPNPAMGIAMPDAGEHPEWAILARENLALYYEFVEYWTRERVHENAELGNWVGDDTDLLQDWADLALIYDPQGRYRKVVRDLADGMYNRYVLRGQYFITHGLNSRWTDGLHAYEDGLNMQPMELMLSYGDPEIFSRLMETASRYDGFLFTAAENGRRSVNTPDTTGMLFWSTLQTPRGDPRSSYAYLAAHAGLMLLWYNQNPAVLQLFEEFAQWNLDEMERDPDFNPASATAGWYFYRALYALTGNVQYLRPIIDVSLLEREGQLKFTEAGAGRLGNDPAWFKDLPEEWYTVDQVVTEMRQEAPSRFKEIGTRYLGFSDRRFEKNWLEWHLTGNKAYLVEGLQELYRALVFTMPARTVAEQSGDRVSLPKQLISQMYLGGVPAARNNQLFPRFAVSYTGLSLDFAALVLEDRTDKLRVLFYNFEKQAQHGGMQVWNLQPGTYLVRTGLDLNGEDKIDQLVDEFEIELKRGELVPLTLPSQQLFVLEIEQLSSALPLAQRPDPAIGESTVHRSSDGVLKVEVLNLGTVAVHDVQVALQDAKGQAVAIQNIPLLSGSDGFEVRSAILEFDAEISSRARFIVIDPEYHLQEITRNNNRLQLKEL